MTTVSTKEELKQAFSNKERKIIVVGNLATEMRKKSKIKKASKIGGLALIIGGLIATPFTGGLSLAGATAGMALTIGTLTMTTLELTILCGFALGMYGIHNKCKVSFNSDGSVTVEPTYN